MKKNWYFLVICIFLISTGLLVIFTSRVSSLNPINNANGNSKVKLKELPYIAQEIAWDTDGNPVCIDSTVSQNYLEICSDGAEGAIVTWYDNRNGDDDIFAQRIDSDGDALWGDDGLEICTEVDNQRYPKICSDGAGGAIITWHDYRGTNCDIYAQHINSEGNVQWDANGTVICDEVQYQTDPNICSDGAGGAIIIWKDQRGIDYDIYAQRIDFNGTVQWDANGTAICEATTDQDILKLCSDGIGGAIITWKDTRNGNWDIYGKRIDSVGNTEWGGTNGKAICEESHQQGWHQMISDEAEGAIIIWEDRRNSSISGADLYAQHVDADGNLEWGVNDKMICNASDDEWNPQLCSDGAGGAIITWQEGKSVSNWDIYAQYVDSIGNLQWDANGTVICDSIEDQENPQICSDGGGGAIITWQDDRNDPSNDDIYAQRINSSGINQWLSNGTVLCNENNLQREPKIISDGLGGAIIAWEDERDGTDYDLYAQKINNPAPTSNHPADVTTSMEGTETINWTLSDDSGGGQYRVMANLTGGSDSIVRDWTSWTSGTTLHIPIDRTSAGTFAYRIEYYDDQNRSGTPDAVVVQITEDSSINGYSIFILSMSVCTIGLIFAIRLKKKKNLIY